MDDLVTRLRQLERFPLMVEAADEIERLRHANGTHRDGWPTRWRLLWGWWR